MKVLLSLFFAFNFYSLLAQLDKEHVFPWTQVSVSACKVVDFNNDGMQDILINRSGLCFVENSGGTFELPKCFGPAGNKIYTEDFDGDGDLDLLTLSRGRIFYRETLDQESLDLGVVEDISFEYSEGGFGFSYLVDLDGDGDTDIVNDGLSWYENTSNDITDIGEEIILHENDGSYENQRLQFVDFDDDGDLDILSLIRLETNEDRKSQILWFENNGDATFKEPYIVVNAFKGIYLAIFIAEDIDSDGDIDFLINQVDQKVVLFRNDGDNSTFSREDIVPYYDAAADTRLHDINNDGNLDLFTIGHGGIRWTLGKSGGTFEDEIHVLSNVDPPNPSYDICFGDFDQDGDDDLFYPGISLQTIPTRASWFENEYTELVQTHDEYEENIQVFPNPAYDYFKVEGINVERVEVINTNGEVVLDSKGDEVNVQSLKSDLYFIKIYDQYSKNFSTKKLKVAH